MTAREIVEGFEDAVDRWHMADCPKDAEIEAQHLKVARDTLVTLVESYDALIANASAHAVSVHDAAVSWKLIESCKLARAEVERIVKEGA